MQDKKEHQRLKKWNLEIIDKRPSRMIIDRITGEYKKKPVVRF